MHSDELKTHWDKYLSEGEDSLLIGYIESHPQTQLMCEHKEPYLHRICDVILEGRQFRVLRCVMCNERLVFKPIGSEYSEEQGVPYWLSGQKLREWADVEKAAKDAANDLDEEYWTKTGDWEQWRDAN